VGKAEFLRIPLHTRQSNAQLIFFELLPHVKDSKYTIVRAGRFTQSSLWVYCFDFQRF
jgi:hypothetical protein